MPSLRFAAASMIVATLCSLSATSFAEAPPGESAPADAKPAAQPAPEPPPPAPEPKKHGPRLPGILVMALGAAGLAAGGAFGIVAITKGASARSQCTGNLCPPSAADDINITKNFQAASYGSFAAGGTIALAGLILTIVAPGKPEDSARLGPWVGKGSAGLGFSASF